MSDKDKELNLTDSMKQREKNQKETKENGSVKRTWPEEENEEPLNPKRHCGDVSSSGSTGSTSSSHSAESPASEDNSSAGSYVLSSVSKEAERLERQDIPGGTHPSGAGFSGRGILLTDLSGAASSGAGPRTKAKQKIWFREATSTSSSPGFKHSSSEEEKDPAMELEE